MTLPVCLTLTRQRLQALPTAPPFLITPTLFDQHPQAQGSHPISLKPISLTPFIPAPTPNPLSCSPACRCTSQGSRAEPEASGEQADSVFQELPNSCGVLSGTPTGDLQPWQSHIHSLAHVDAGECPAYTQVSTRLPVCIHTHTHTLRDTKRHNAQGLF